MNNDMKSNLCFVSSFLSFILMLCFVLVGDAQLVLLYLFLFVIMYAVGNHLWEEEKQHLMIVDNQPLTNEKKSV